MDTTQSRRLVTGLLAGGLLLVPLAGCSGDEATPDSSVLDDAGSAASSASSAISSAAGSVGEAVDCSGSTCSVTLDADAGEVELLGTTASFGGVQDGEATFTVAGREISCSEGDSVDAGPLRLECTTVDEDSVTFSASLG